MNVRLLYPAIVFLMVFANCKSSPDLESRWRDRDITIDGSAAEWSGLIQYPHEDQFGIGIINDEKYLYLCMVTLDESLGRQIERFGFTAWFTATGSNGKRLGVHFPVGLTAGSFKGAGMRGQQEGEEQARRQQLEASLQNIELIGPAQHDSLFMKTRIAETFGIVARIQATPQNFVYELKIPLHADSLNKYALDIGNNGIIRAHVETCVPDFEALHDQREQRASPDMQGSDDYMPGDKAGFSRGGSMHGGGHHGGGGHYREPMPEQFTLDFSFSLAHSPHP